MSGRRILMTADAVGGVWQYACDLAGALAQGGDTVMLAVIGPPPSAAQRRCLEGAEQVRLIETGLPLDWMCTSTAEASRTARGLAELARTCRADLVHCNSPALVGVAEFPVPVVAVAHGCIATWWQAAKGGAPLDPGLHWHSEMMRRGLMAADAAIAPSASFAASLRATYRLAKMPLVVHNGRTPSAAAATGRTPPMDAVLTAGRLWDPVKNAALLDAVAARIDLSFLAAGPARSPHGEEVALPHMVMLGELPGETLAELLARRPIFVSGATFEPFGLAVLEAAAAGCALVLSDIATFRELWAGAALFVAPDDPEGFATAIGHLHANPTLRAEMGAAARTRAARYTPAACARGVEAVYRTLITSREAAA